MQIKKFLLPLQYKQTIITIKTITTMGCRLHSATKYEVQYGDYGTFNYHSDSINPIIGILCEDDYFANDDYLASATTIDANRETLLANLEKITNPDKDWELQEDLDNAIKTMEKEGEIDREYLYKGLKKLIENADTRNEYVHFSWF